jgi:hypothetical protein
MKPLRDKNILRRCFSQTRFDAFRLERLQNPEMTGNLSQGRGLYESAPTSQQMIKP